MELLNRPASAPQSQKEKNDDEMRQNAKAFIESGTKLLEFGVQLLAKLEDDDVRIKKGRGELSGKGATSKLLDDDDMKHLCELVKKVEKNTERPIDGTSRHFNETETEATDAIPVPTFKCDDDATAVTKFWTFTKNVFFKTLGTSEDLFGQFYGDRAQEVFGFREMMGFGIFWRAAFLTILVYFTYINYMAMAFTQKFVALDPSSGNCEQNTKSYTMTILADKNGSWAGSVDFSYTQAMYSFTFSNLEATPAQFADFMADAKAALKTIGDAAKYRDIAVNILYWSNWQTSFVTYSPSTGTYNTQVLTLSANSPSILNFNNYDGSMGNYEGDCALLASTIRYDMGNAALIQSYDLSVFDEYPDCQGILQMDNLGYRPTVDGSTFTVSFDVRTHFAALAVAYHVDGDNTIDVFETDRIITDNFYFYGTGQRYIVLEKFDNNYPNMRPMTCVGPYGTSDKSDWNCLLPMGNGFVFPFFQPTGTNLDFPDKCDCSKPSGNNKQCNSFDFLMGGLAYNISSNLTALEPYDGNPTLQALLPFMELFYVPPHYYSWEINEKSYYPAFAAIFSSTANESDNELTRQLINETWRNEKYEFTRTNSFGLGSFIAFRVHSDNGTQTVTQYNFNLENASCGDSFTSDMFDNLATVPFGPLIEAYYQCTMYPGDALNNALGIATGLAGLITPFGMVVILYTVYALASWRKHILIHKELKADKGDPAVPVSSSSKGDGGLGASEADDIEMMMSPSRKNSSRSMKKPYSDDTNENEDKDADVDDEEDAVTRARPSRPAASATSASGRKLGSSTGSTKKAAVAAHHDSAAPATSLDCGVGVVEGLGSFFFDASSDPSNSTTTTTTAAAGGRKTANATAAGKRGAYKK